MAAKTRNEEEGTVAGNNTTGEEEVVEAGVEAEDGNSKEGDPKVNSSLDRETYCTSFSTLNIL